MTRTAILLLIVAAAAIPPAALAQPTAQQGAEGTYVGRQIGSRGEVVTIILAPRGDATVAIARYHGARPDVSRGRWRLLTPGDIRLDIAGEAGSGTIEFFRSNDQLTAVDRSVRLSTRLPLVLVRQAPVPGTYAAVRTSAGVLQSLTLQLNPDGSASMKVDQTSPKAQPAIWTGTWAQSPSGDVQVTLAGSGGSDRFTLTRSNPTMLTMSVWNRAVWGPSPIVFARG